jgi:hypothetical protein
MITTIKNFINESHRTDAEIDAMLNSIKDNILTLFPDSYVSVGHSRRMAHSGHIIFALGKDKSEWENGYIDNDPAHHKFYLWLEDEKIEVKLQVGGGLYVKPAEGSYMALDRVKCNWRNMKIANHGAIIKNVTAYFANLKDIIASNLDNMRPFDKEVAARKI